MFLQRHIFWIILLVAAAYANSFNNGWHFDDFDNIVKNQSIQIENLSFASLQSAIIANPGSGLPYRPISFLTLAINWFFSQSNTFGYHIFNIGIHILTALVLYATILLLYKTPKLGNTNPGGMIQGIALFATLFWALNPIQTQGVTYIVQRMSSLAALFSLIGIHQYLTLRVAQSSLTRYRSAFFLIISFLLAVGSKENAIMLPCSLLLIECIFFGKTNKEDTVRFNIIATGVVLTIALLAFFYCFPPSEWSLLKAYGDRSFSLHERLLSAPRIILFYLSLLFFPLPSRLSLTHDFAVSQSLLSPPSTLLSFIALGMLIGASLIQLHRKPLFTFSILFFLLNHLIESTVLPLELIFEHRNYLPSLFLFVPLADWLFRATSTPGAGVTVFYKRKVLLLGLSVLVIALLAGTITRNSIWATEETLCKDCLQKSPGQARPVSFLAELIAEKGDKQGALELLNKSLTLDSPSSPAMQHSRTLSRMGLIHYELGNKEQGIAMLRETVKLMPDYPYFRYHLAKLLFDAGNHLQEAEQILLEIVQEKQAGSETFGLLGNISLKQGNPDQAISYFTRSLQSDPDNLITQENLILALMAGRKYIIVENMLLQINATQQSNCFYKSISLTLYTVNKETNFANHLSKEIADKCPLGKTIQQQQKLIDSGIDKEIVNETSKILSGSYKELNGSI